MKRFLIYAAVFIAGFVTFVLIFAPAATVWQLSRSQIERQLPNLQVTSVEGTIWSGSANLRYWNFPSTDVHWRILPLSLLRGRLDFVTVASGNHIHLETNGSIAPGHIDAVSNGIIDSAWINPVSTQYGLKFTGKLTVNALHLVSDFRWFSEADGMLHWNGGPIYFQTARGPQGISLPALDGALQEAGEDLHLDVTHASRRLLNVVLHRSGWAKVDLKTRLFKTANLPWPAGEKQEDTALSVEEQLFSPR